MKQTTLVQHLQHQQKLLGATGEFTTLMNEILVAVALLEGVLASLGLTDDKPGEQNPDDEEPGEMKGHRPITRSCHRIPS